VFGTDGIRGRAGSAPLDETTLMRLGSVLGELLTERSADDPVLIADDGRRSGPMIRGALCRGLSAESHDVHDAGLLTTPALAHETRLGDYAAGIMISASHNPAADNGLKIFGPNGSKLGDEIEAEIERRMTRADAHPVADASSEPHELGEPGANYRAFLQERFPGLDLSGLRVLVDCANGAGSNVVPTVLEEFGAQLEVRNAVPNGDNINDHCGALHPDVIARDVVKSGCDLGLCLDGDGDRSIFIDENGTVVPGDALLMMLAISASKRGTLTANKLVVTVMSNVGLRKALAGYGIGLVETPVGDRAVVAAMRKHRLVLGGEPSGHVVFGPEHSFTGDGLYTALKVLDLLANGDQKLSELAAGFTAFPQLLVNVGIGSEKPDLATVPEIVAARDEIQGILGDDGRIVLRYSGTENLCRVMLEGPDEQLVSDLTHRLADVVARALAGTE